jgi:HEAT repeat protein
MRHSVSPEWEYVLKKAWDPRWQHVIVLLAGRLSLAPARYLLERLADEAEDDAFHSRLAVAALCLPEIEQTDRDRLTELSDRIATRVAAAWWKNAMRNIQKAMPHLVRATTAVVRADGRVEAGAFRPFEAPGRELSATAAQASRPLPEHLADLLSAPDPSVHEVEFLADRDPTVHEVATRAVVVLGRAGATEPFLGRLVELLADADPIVRQAAARAVGGLGGAAATDPILARLAELLADADPSVRWYAVRAVESLGGRAAGGLNRAARGVQVGTRTSKL